MKLIVLFCVILLGLSLLACKARRPAVSYGMATDTTIVESLELVDIADVKTTGFDFPVGGTVTVGGSEITRIDSSRYLVKQPSRTIRQKETRTELVQTVDKSKTKIVTSTRGDIDRSKSVVKDIDRSKELLKITKKNGLPWYIIVMAIAAIAVYLMFKFMNHKPFG